MFARAAAAVAVVAVAACVAVGCSDLVPPPANAPVAVDGVLDASTWDFERDGPIALDGTWLFTWHARATTSRNDAVPMHVPGQWDAAGFDGVGYGTFRLTLKLPPSSPPSSPSSSPFALAKSHADSAYAVFAASADNDHAPEPVIASGVVATDDAGELREGRYAIGALPAWTTSSSSSASAAAASSSASAAAASASSSSAASASSSASSPSSAASSSAASSSRATAATAAYDVVLLSEVSNFGYPRGGEGASTMLGTPAQLEKRRDDQRSRDFFVAGFIVVVGLYHLALFTLRRSERAPLFFGLFCVVIALRALERGRHIEDLLPSLHLWAATKRVEYLGFYLAVPLFTGYIDALVKNVGSSLHAVGRVAVPALFLAMAAVVVVTPPLVFGHTANVAQVAALASIAWMLWGLVRAYRFSHDRVLLVVLGGFVILGTTVVLDILSNRALIALPIVTPVGQAAFVVAQAAVIASGNARARKAAEDLARELLRVSKLKDEFLANTSHELRTPLNAIINIPHGLLQQIEERSVVVCGKCGEAFEPSDDPADTLSDVACPNCDAVALTVEQRRFVTEDPDELAARLRSIIGSGEHLLAVVNDILDYSKIASGQLELHRESLSLKDVVDRALVTVRPLAQSASVELNVRIDDAVRVHADRTRLAQIVINLVANAVKFSPAGAAVDVVADGGGGGRDVVLRVVDHGLGIAPENHALIFESFRQIEGGHTRKHGGTGLGLAIVKQLVEMHGGTIAVESAAGKGATFIVRLPAAA